MTDTAPTGYHYNAITGELRAAQPLAFDTQGSKHSGEPLWLLPAFCTLAGPPGIQPGFARCYLSAAGAWSWQQVPDFRGQPLWDAEGVDQPAMTAPGALPDGVTNVPTPAILTAALARARTAAKASLIAAANVITGGLTGAYAQAEVDSWPTQAAEAQIVLSGGVLPAMALLPALAANAAGVAVASVTPQQVHAMAEAIIAKAAGFYAVIHLVQSARYAGSEAIDAAATADAVSAALAARIAALRQSARQIGLLA